MPQILIDDVVRAYKFYAPLYDRLFGGVLEPGRLAMAERVRHLKPSSLLEVGVGTGLTLHRYPDATAIVGIDISPAMLEVARERAKGLGGKKIDLMCVDAERMPFADSSFDCVALPYVLSVTPNPEALVAETRRVCRKGGTILIVNHFSGGSRLWWLLERAVRSLASRIGFRSSFALQEHILKYDWQVQSSEDVNFLRLSKLIVIRNG